MSEKLRDYWSLQNGHKRLLSQMPKETYPIVFQQLREGSAVGQYTLPLFTATDMELSIPHKVIERQEAEETKIAEIRTEISRYIKIPDGIKRKSA